MTREIKFRAWNPNAKEFQGYAGGDIHMPLHETGALAVSPLVFEFMQYTGLKDKNGVEIYEGDIVIGGEPNDSGGWTYNDENNHKTVVKWSNSYKPGFDFPQMCEVIGNIYENPELLKEHNHGE